jgi:hypothetical protein
LVIGIVQDQEPRAVVVIAQPVEYSFDDVNFRVVEFQLPRDFFVALIEASDTTAVYPENVTVGLFELILITVLNSNLRFPVDR